MVLNIEKSYTNKEGEQVFFKYPKMRVIGKNMDEGEEQTFQVLSDGIKTFEGGKYPNYTMFVKIPDTDEAFVLDLSNQAVGEFRALNPIKGDLIKVRKEYRENSQTGAQMPCVVPEKIDQNTGKPVVPIQSETTDALRDDLRGQNEDFIGSEGKSIPEKKVVLHPLKTPTNTIPQKKQYSEIEKKFSETYRQQVNPLEQNVNHFIGTWFRTNDLATVQRLIELFHDIVLYKTEETKRIMELKK